jgi:hypothetical protein
MHRRVKRLLAAVAVAALAASVAAPAAAQAASPRWFGAMTWSDNGLSRSIMAGHQSEIVAHFRTNRTLHRAAFSVRLGGGLYAQPSYVYWGTIRPYRWNALSFSVVVPSWIRSGWYRGTLRLASAADRDDYSWARNPFIFYVRVFRAPPVPTIAWTPAGLGRITVQAGQTVTATASFVSNRPLSDVQVVTDLSSYATSHGLSVAVAPALPSGSSLAAGSRVGVVLTVSAAPTATAGAFGGDVHLLASYGGRPQQRLWHDLDFVVAVQQITPHLTWMPSDHFGRLALTNGQIITSWPRRAAASGVALDVVAVTPAMTAVAAGVPYTVTFTVSAAPTATAGTYDGDLFVSGSYGGAAPATLSPDLDLVVVVARLNPLVTWSTGSPVSYASITRNGTSVVTATETASFTTNVPLTNASLSATLDSAAAAEGLTITAAPFAGNAVAPNVPTAASFTIGVPASAEPGVYSGDLWIVGQAPDMAVPARIYHHLHFVFAVN